MANFTTTQANACIVNKWGSFKLGGIHQHFEFDVTDDNGCIYNWQDHELISNATKAQKKRAVQNHLISIEKKGVPPVKSYDEDSTGILGGTLGSI